MPIRWRLTFWYTGILLLILIILGSSVYLLLEYSLMTEMDNNLSNKADEVLKSAKVVGTLPFFLRQIVLPDVQVFAAPDVYLQVVGKDGEIASKTYNLGKYNLPVEQFVNKEYMKGNILFTSVHVENEELRMVVKPLLLDSDVVGFLQVARPLRLVEQALIRLRNIMIIAVLAALLLSLGLGWFMSGKVLGPIRHLTKEAKAIGEKGDLTRRVTYRGPKDELGELAITFNNMLGNLEDFYNRLAESLALQKRFVADASHELRTPLTSIQGNIDFLLQLEPGNEELEKETLMDISSEARRLSRLVKELLTLARVDSGRQLNLTQMELLPILEETARQARYLLKGQRLEVNMEGAQGVVLTADPDYFKQMLLVFYDNALKYTPEGKRVTFRLETTPEEISLIFSDEGPGIPERDFPHLFERFYRAESSRVGEGTGLGLAIAKWIIDQHGARIDIQSETDKGTTVIVTFPLLSLF